MAYEVIMGLSASYAIVFVGTFTEYPYNKKNKSLASLPRIALK